MIGAVFIRVGGMLASPEGPPGAAGPTPRENISADRGAAEQTQSAEALAPSAASSAGSDQLNDRPEVYSDDCGRYPNRIAGS